MKLDDIPFIAKSINAEMPILRPQSCELPNQQSMAKNFKDACEIQNNKFLNNHLAEIEESFHVFKEIPKGIINYQASKFGDSLNHDNIFKLIPTVRHSQFVINPYSFPAGGGCTATAEFVGLGNTPVSDLSLTTNRTYCNRADATGQTGECFDQIAFKIEVASSTPLLEYGMYDDDGGVGLDSEPDNLEVKGSPVAVSVAYDYENVPETNIDTDIQWISCRKTSGNVDIDRFTNATGGERFFETADWPDPWTATIRSGVPFICKAQHS